MPTDSTSSSAPPVAPSPNGTAGPLHPPDPRRALPPHRAESLSEVKAISQAHAKTLRSLLARTLKRHLPERPAPTPRDEAPPRLVGTHAKALPFLRLIPVVLLVVFGLSFVWDFPGVVLTPFGYALPLDGLLRILAVSGLIGFLTNWLAITMLFQPREPRPIFGQGLIPSQRERVIYRLAKAVSEELINEEIIKQKIEESRIIPRYRELALSVTRGVIEDPEFREDVKALTSDYVEQVLGSDEVRQKIVGFTIQKLEEHAGQGMSGLALKVYRFLGEDDFQRRIDRAVQELPRSLDGLLDGLDDLLDTLPAKLEARSHDIEAWATKTVLGFVENLDVYGMIVGNMRQYDEQQLENLLKNTSNEQLNYIKYLGGILGVFGGFVIWRPVLALSIFGTVGLVLWALDVLLYRRRAALR